MARKIGIGYTFSKNKEIEELRAKIKQLEEDKKKENKNTKAKEDKKKEAENTKAEEESKTE